MFGTVVKNEGGVLESWFQDPVLLLISAFWEAAHDGWSEHRGACHPQVRPGLSSQLLVPGWLSLGYRREVNQWMRYFFSYFCHSVSHIKKSNKITRHLQTMAVVLTLDRCLCPLLAGVLMLGCVYVFFCWHPQCMHEWRLSLSLIFSDRDTKSLNAVYLLLLKAWLLLWVLDDWQLFLSTGS